jgi:hypothetical protein
MGLTDSLPLFLQSISRNFDHKCFELHLRSWQVCCEVRKFILEFTSQFVNKVPDCMVPEEKEANQMHSLQTGYCFVNLIMNF